MDVVVKAVGSVVVAAALAFLLTVYLLGLPTQSGVNTALIAAGVALVIVYLNRES